MDYLYYNIQEMHKIKSGSHLAHRPYFGHAPSNVSIYSSSTRVLIIQYRYHIVAYLIWKIFHVGCPSWLATFPLIIVRFYRKRNIFQFQDSNILTIYFVIKMVLSTVLSMVCKEKIEKGGKGHDWKIYC